MNGRSSLPQNDRTVIAGLCIFLVAIVFLAFDETIRCQFINYDDDMYVYQNPVVTRGLTWHGISWAFTYALIGHWHPVTWFSHMLDCQLFGWRAGEHHAMNVLLHMAAAVLLFLALYQMTHAIWRSGFVAALFAIHPQRVESVAWIAERKDVLSGVFFMLSLLAYLRYVRGRRTRGSYLLVAISFALGLMAKGMLVTLPFVLLLLDWWPLGRLTHQKSDVGGRRLRFGGLVIEKIPLFVLSALSILATSLSPEKIAPALRESLSARLENAIVSYVIYLKQFLYPRGLLLPYFNPPGGFSIVEVIFALALLIAISLGVIFFRKAHPYLAVGWFWYVGIMLPVIGFIQISYYARADRYTYLPHIGLYLMVTWGAADLFTRWRRGREFLVVAAVAVIAALVVKTRAQASYWHDSETLWSHVLNIDPDNYVACTNLGLVLDNRGEPQVAIDEYKRALKIQPAYVEAHNNLGNALARVGRLDEAIVQYQKALDLQPDLPQVHNNLGAALAQNGQLGEAIAHFRKAIEINPETAGAHSNLGYALMQAGQPKQALPQLGKALELKPDAIDAHRHLADLLLEKGQFALAIIHYRQVIEKRDDDEARTKLAWILATAPDAKLRNGAEALILAKESCDRTSNPDVEQLDALAAAYAELRDFQSAKDAAVAALSKAKVTDNSQLAEQIEQRLELYRRQQPYRQPRL